MNNGYTSLNIPSLNGLQTIKADEITTGSLTSDNIYLDTLETSNIIIDTDITMQSGASIVANGTTITDVELSYIDGLTSNAQTQITTNANNISTNTSNISTNTTNIATNTSDIATNATNIATNTSDIATNTADIASIDVDLSTAESNIATNTSNISTNTTNISTNTSNIATNTSNISTNTSNISTNTSNISTNTTNIATNTSNISTNTSDIATIESTITPLSYTGGGYDDLTISSDLLLNKSYGLHTVSGTGSTFRMTGSNCRFEITGSGGVLEFSDASEQTKAFSSDYSTLLDDITRSSNEWTFPVNTLLKAGGGGAIDEIRCDHINCYTKVEYPDATIQTTAFTATDRTDLDTLTSKKNCYWEEIDDPVTYFSSMAYNTTYQTSSGGHYMTSSELSTTPTGGDSNMIDSSGYIQYTGRYMLQVSFEIMGIKSWTDIRARVLVKKNGTLERATLYGPGVWDANRGSVSTVGCTLAPLIFTVGDVADNWTFEIHTYNNFQTVGSGSIFWKTHIDLVQL